MIVGLTSGAFDLLHFGHLRYLESCKALCDTLLVGVDSDEMVRGAKDTERPFVPELERLSLIRAQRCVDAAFMLHRLDDLRVIALQFKVNKVFKHEGFKAISKIVGVDGTGAQLVIVPDVPGLVSTTELVAKIRGKEKEHVSSKHDLNKARECYFAAGGAESEIGPRGQAEWYWRRAATTWRDIANSDGSPHTDSDQVVGKPIETTPASTAPQTLADASEVFERNFLVKTLRSVGGVRGLAAARLGISRKNLWEKMRRYNVAPSELTPESSYS